MIRALGVDKVMWGSDYPHSEGTTPYTLEALRYVFHDWDPDDLQTVLGGTAAEVYHLDLGQLAEHGVGPTVEEVATPLADDAKPPSKSMAFTSRPSAT